MTTTRIQINVHSRNHTIGFDGEKINFNIHDAKRYPSDVSSLYFSNTIKPLTQYLFDLTNGDVLEMILSKHFHCEKLERKLKLYSLDRGIEEMVNKLLVNDFTMLDVKQVELPQTHIRFPHPLSNHWSSN